MLSQVDKQIVRSWRRRLVDSNLAKLTGKRRPLRGPRIAVVGNCQSFGVAYAMKLLDPNAEVEHYSAIGKTVASIELFAKTLASYDYVFSHEFPAGFIRGGGSDELRAVLTNMMFFPPVVFTAFHPDLIYLLDETRGHKPTIGPVGPYHSALAAFAFRRGLSLQEANALFNRNVYEALGYFGLWDASAREFIETAKSKYDLDFSAELMSWARRGVFMYSIVHPRPFVLFDVAKKLFARVGLAVPDIDKDYFFIDDLARAEVFPIYPPIGEVYGVPGSYTFKLENYHLSSTVGYFMTLPEYLDKSYEVYRRCRRTQLTHVRLEAWLGDSAMVTMLTDFARRNLEAGLLPVR